MSPLTLLLVAIVTAWMWALVFAILAFGTACVRAICCKTCVRTFNDLMRRLGASETDEPEGQFRLIFAVFGGYALYVGVTGFDDTMRWSREWLGFLRSP